jgi:molybdenum-dependent DNA-binding transcriptional regulator ModE
MLCDEMGMNYHSVWQRINRCGWSVDRALTEPFRKRVM